MNGRGATRAAEERLEVACWCGVSTVWIPAGQVGQMTASCGERLCLPPALVAGRLAADFRDRVAAEHAERLARARDPLLRELIETTCAHCARLVFSAQRIATCGDCASSRRKGRS